MLKERPNLRVAVVIPTFKARSTIVNVVKTLPAWVQTIVVVDDACPDESGAHLESSVEDHRLVLVYNSENQGVGGATKAGILKAIEQDPDLVVKMDADLQMDPKFLEEYLELAKAGALYIKGNRLAHFSDFKNMPLPRLIGNWVLTGVTQLGTGMYGVKDPTNGYIGISQELLKRINWAELNDGYFFETDLLYQIERMQVSVCEVKMPSRYDREVSQLSMWEEAFNFLFNHSKRFSQRLLRSKFLK